MGKGKGFSGVRLEKLYVCLFVFALLTNSYKSYALTTGTIVSFVSGTGVTNHASTPSTYTFSNPSNQLSVVAVNAGTNYPAFTIDLPQVVDLSKYAYLRVKVKTTNNLNLRIDYESNGLTTNGGAVSRTIPAGSNFGYYTYSIGGGNFSQSYPQYAIVDPTTVSKLWVYFNPGGSPSNFSGTVVFDSIWVGDYTGNLTPPQVPIPNSIYLNQLGFYPNAPKIAVVPGTANISFNIIDSLQSTVAYTGVLSSASAWDVSGENVSIADFSTLTLPGKYFVSIPGYAFSSSFQIADSLFNNIAIAGLKAFYYQRASTAISASFGGVYARAAGHPDNNVLVHASAASSQRPTGTAISSPRGWYDAGDYNKYIVNSGISTNTLLAILESFPQQSKDWSINIPETGNGLPDILNESLWNIRWMLTMQDPNDGGVYHKLTEANFSGFVMPNAVNSTRYVVQKSTAATLDFAAVMAQASRVAKRYPSELSGLADSCLSAALNAWKWAQNNPTVYYNQSTLNTNFDPDINTGEYWDNNVSDEFHWAALELYITTKADSFLTLSGGLESSNLGLPGWADVRTLGYYSLANNRKNLTSAVDTSLVKSLIIGMADGYYQDIQNSPYRVGMKSGLFYWGSNSNAANQTVALLMAYRLTKDINYYQAALHNFDYLLGRNPTGYSYVTGFGKKRPMFPHHRPSGADGIVDPVPGFMVGGPQNQNHSGESSCGAYSSFSAKAYLDLQCSHSTNEVAINWNAPFTFLAFGLENAARENSYSSTTGIEIQDQLESAINLYPNPSENEINVIYPNGKFSRIEIYDISGARVYSNTISTGWNAQIDVSALSSGIYLVKLAGGELNAFRRFVKI